MGGIFSQLGQLFVQTIPTVIFVFLLLLVLDQIFFKPITRVLKRREELTSGALAQAREQMAAAEAKAREYEAAFQSARQEVYRQREADRQLATKEREAALHKAREHSEALLAQAQLDLAAEVEAAKQELGRVFQPMANEIVELVLGNGSPAGGQGGARP